MSFCHELILILFLSLIFEVQIGYSTNYSYTEAHTLIDWGDELVEKYPLGLVDVKAAKFADLDGDGDDDLALVLDIADCPSLTSTHHAIQIYRYETNRFVDQTNSTMNNYIGKLAKGLEFIPKADTPNRYHMVLCYPTLISNVLIAFSYEENFSFQEATGKIILGTSPKCLSNNPFYSADYNLDGMIDLLVTFSQYTYLMQLPNATFVDQTKSQFVTPISLGSSSCIGFGMVESTGFGGIIQTLFNFSVSTTQVFPLLKNGTFGIPRLIGQVATVSTCVLAFADFDGDGLADLFLSGSEYPSNQLTMDIYRNLDNYNFTVDTKNLAIKPTDYIPVQNGYAETPYLTFNNLPDLFYTGLDNNSNSVSVLLSNIYGNGSLIETKELISMRTSAFASSKNFRAGGTRGFLHLGLSQPSENQLIPAAEMYEYNEVAQEFQTALTELFVTKTFYRTLEKGVALAVHANGDSCIDLYVTGMYQPAQTPDRVAVALLYGNCNGSFTVSQISLSRYIGLAIWADFDNDGFTEFLNTGITPKGLGSTQFVGGTKFVTLGLTVKDYNTSIVFRPSLPVITEGLGLVLDFDEDGLKDLLIAGSPISDPPVAIPYRNMGGLNFSAPDAFAYFIPSIEPFVGTCGLLPAVNSQIMYADSKKNRLNLYVRASNMSYMYSPTLLPQLGYIVNASDNTLACAAMHMTEDLLQDILILGPQPSILVAHANGSYLSLSSSAQRSFFNITYGAATPLDFDGDGWMDVFVAGSFQGQGIIALYRGLGNATFENVTGQVLPTPRPGFVFSAAVAAPFSTTFDNLSDIFVVGRNPDCGFSFLRANHSSTPANPGGSGTGSSPAVPTTSGGGLDNSESTSDNALSTSALIGLIVGSSAAAGSLLATCCAAVLLLCCLALCVAILVILALLAALVALFMLGIVAAMVASSLGAVNILFRGKRRSHADDGPSWPAERERGKTDEELRVLAESTKSYEVIPWDDLHIVRSLGKGAFGEVMLARWKGVEVAAKIVPVSSEEAMRDFSNEALLLSKVSHHPHIVQFLAAAYGDHAVAMVLKLCMGGSLKAALEAGRLSSVQKMRILAETAGAVAFLHSMNIVHRDLAARYVLLEREDGSAQLADFGLGRALTKPLEEQHTSCNLGPVRWMAPEALTRRAYSPASDAFAFGILMWEVWSDGATPYAEFASVADVALHVTRNDGRPQIPAATPGAHATIMHNLWATRPEDRPTMAAVCEAISLPLQKSLLSDSKNTSSSSKEDSAHDVYVQAHHLG